ncbi:MAG: flagellar hook-associated protein FlgK [Deltaproteobacteria bacterium]|jgi:flagellar hook-associated protein 1 FlgK|nr:flagellar hook-associated protein FlgK [Deltaproteobacteria bacterium]
MSISSSMYVALTGMRMSQAAMETASNNIANVNTPGYSRQRINLATLPSQTRSWGQMGLGVTGDNIIRYHDEFLTRSLIMTGSTLGKEVAIKNQVDNLEIFFNESAGNGINAAMNDYFAAFDQLADEANNEPNREELIEYAQTLATQLKYRKEEMDELRLDTNKRIDDAATEINTLIAELASLNKEITVYEDPTLNRQANDLRDTREEKTRQLAEYMDIEYYEDPHDGQWTITTGTGIPLVLKERSFPLTTNTSSNGDVSLHTSHNDYWQEDITGQITGGAVGGYIEFRDEILSEYYKQYESFVDGFIFQANNQHAQGTGLSLMTEVLGTTQVSNLASVEIDFPGDDNSIRISSLVPHLASKEPYDPYSDPDNIEVRFVKSEKVTSEITSTVKFNEDPARMKWEITITLPVDSLGNVSVTAAELTEYINSERSLSPTDGINYLPPRTVAWKVGDFISAEGVFNQSDTGRVNFAGPTLPQGHEEIGFYSLSRSLKYTAPQGHHLAYDSEYATLKTTLIHTDNDIIYTAVDKGETGDKISVEYVNTGANQKLLISVTQEEDGSQRIVVNLATDVNGDITSTAGDIVSAINSHNVARTLVTAETPQGETGLGLAREMDRTFLDRSGYFELVTYTDGGEATFHKVTVTPEDTLEDVIKQIADIPGLRVESVTDRHGKDNLRIIADTGVEFGFAGDSSGALAVLGINTIFTGTLGNDVGVNQMLIDNRELINAGIIDSNGVRAPGSNENALDMADLKDKRFDFYHQKDATISSMFNSIYSNIGATAQGATRDYEFTQGVYTQLQDRQDSIAGVNLDEELADVLRYQYMYQASAKMISTIDTMMESLLAMR